ncbi:MAG: ATP-binding cassette domain-containing protein [Archangiaceae bacterium]|nr:ATP-binding cassette domain-containing protein [Archangiaceae bacterium]
MSSLVSFEQVSIGHRRGEALLPPISWSIGRGDLIGVLGPNGSGKSTFLKTLLGLLPPLAGRVVHPQGRPPRLGYVPQSARPDFAYPLSVLQVVLMGRAAQLGLVRRPGHSDVAVARRQLEAVGLGALADQPFRSLSGGQQQRALVARALAAEPELLVLDEPTSEMDPAAEHALLSLVGSLTRSRDVGVIFVTHEISSAAGFGRGAVLVDRRAQYFEAGLATELITSERMSRLYGRPIEVRREGDRVLVWLAAHHEETR